MTNFSFDICKGTTERNGCFIGKVGKGSTEMNGFFIVKVQNQDLLLLSMLHIHVLSIIFLSNNIFMQTTYKSPLFLFSWSLAISLKASFAVAYGDTYLQCSWFSACPMTYPHSVMGWVLFGLYLLISANYSDGCTKYIIYLECRMDYFMSAST